MGITHTFSPSAMVRAGIAAFVATHYLLGQLQPGNDVDKGSTKKVRKILKGRRKKLRKFLKDSDSSEQVPVCAAIRTALTACKI